MRSASPKARRELLAQHVDLRARRIAPRDRLGDARLDRRLLSDRQLDSADDAEHVLLLRPHAVGRFDAESGFASSFASRISSSATRNLRFERGDRRCRRIERYVLPQCA